MKVEASSPSTEKRDPSDKLLPYLPIASLTDYPFISQDQPLVELYSHLADGQWHFQVLRGLSAIVPLTELALRLSSAEIYDRVEFLPKNDFADENLPSA